MKKKIVTLSLASLLTGPALTYVQNLNATTEEDSVVLESSILHAFDGTAIGINADVIELIGLIRREINKILVGEKAQDGSMVGRYLIDDQLYSIKDLALIEQDAAESLQQELQHALVLAKKDLHTCVEPFIESIHSVKHQILELIKESCQKRGMNTTALLRWSEAKEGEEPKIFNEEVTSFSLYNQFCTDLLNFLGDLIRSCPKGMAQFKMRSDKCQKARTIIKAIVTKRNSTSVNSNALEQKFMRHLKENHIDKMTITEITKEKLEPLFTKFINQKN